MEIITEGYPKDTEVLVDSVSITYYQPPDCTENDESEPQLLTISTRNNGCENFINIKATNWSIDKPEDLLKIIEDFKERAEIV